MCKVFFSTGISLDGFIAGLNASPTNLLGDGGAEIHKWIFLQRSFRRIANLGDNVRRQDSRRDIQSDRGEYYRNEVV
jgi:hypothetical protein